MPSTRGPYRGLWRSIKNQRIPSFFFSIENMILDRHIAFLAPRDDGTEYLSHSIFNNILCPSLMDI